MADNKLLRLIAGDLAIAIAKTEGGAVIRQIRDRKKQKNILSHDAPLFELTVRRIDSDENISVLSNGGFKNCRFVSLGSISHIILADCDSMPGVSVDITATAEKDIITFDTHITAVSDEFSLLYCDYMHLSFDKNDSVRYFFPYGSGTVHDTSREDFRQTENYPSYGVAMEYFCIYDVKTKRGIYYGLHDPAPAYKKLFVEHKKGSEYMTVASKYPMTDIDVPRNSQSLAGRLVWQIYDGDWYDAALLYRNFVTKEAAWMPQNIKDGCREDIPDWFLKNSHWWRIRMKEDDGVVDTLFEAQKILGVPSCVHLYDWHKNPYDNDYPHYFPVKDAMPTVVRRLQEQGLKVMPYINGRLWDTRDRGLDDWQWSTVAKPGCTKDRHGEPFIETYSSKESDGSSVRLSIMCPTTAVWQEKVRENVEKLLHDYDVDGVYIDQIGAAAPYLCEDRNHAHRPGGGVWWCEHYRNLLDHVSRVTPQRKIITTECNADPYTRSLDGFLTWLWVRDNEVPAYPAVYAGLVSMFGRHYDSLPMDEDDGQRIVCTESLLFGDQMGWIMPERFLAMPCRDYYCKLVKARETLAEYFWRGTMLRPPVITDDGEMLYTDKSKESPMGILKHRPTFAAAWQRHDSKRAYIFCNASKNAVNAKIETELADGEYITNQNKKVRIKNGKTQLKLEPESVIWITV